MSEGNDHTTLRFSCFCNQVKGSVKVPTSKLPLPCTFCHCNICRHQSGELCVSLLGMPDGYTAFEVQGPLKQYNASKDVNRFFCSHCGTNVYMQGPNPGEADLCTGVLENDDDILDPQNHIFVTDTRDGGLRDWLPDIKAWEGYSKQSQQIDGNSKIQLPSRSTDGRELYAYCQCRGVQFKITRPNEASKTLSSPSCDLLTPYTSGATDELQNSPWWLCGSTKYLAGTCACDSCRKASGFEIQTWCFLPKPNLLQMNGEPIDFGMGTLKTYSSSKGVSREFCRVCGATVFWRGDERPQLIDVSVGLLDANEGSRAESWLSWKTNRISFEEEAQKKSLVGRVGAGLKQWGQLHASSSSTEA